MWNPDSCGEYGCYKKQQPYWKEVFKDVDFDSHPSVGQGMDMDGVLAQGFANLYLQRESPRAKFIDWPKVMAARNSASDGHPTIFFDGNAPDASDISWICVYGLPNYISERTDGQPNIQPATLDDLKNQSRSWWLYTHDAEISQDTRRVRKIRRLLLKHPFDTNIRQQLDNIIKFYMR